MKVLVTGGSGFIGSALVKALVKDGDAVRVLDNNSRGTSLHREAEFVAGDIRDALAVSMAVRGVNEVIHLAYVNGTKTFYSDPDLVLDVAVKGIVNVIDACRRHSVKRLTLASSSEVCRAKLVMPDETIPLVIPDPHNPRYSYSAGKIISEMMALHSKAFERLLIFRPFNIYGPGMADGHVIPDFAAQLRQLNGKSPAPFKILGNGGETRSFCYIDDLIDGVMIMRQHGVHNGIHNIGTPVETTIGELAHMMARIAGREIVLQQADELREGDAVRRQPDIGLMMALGYAPKVSLEEGLRKINHL